MTVFTYLLGGLLQLVDSFSKFVLHKSLYHERHALRLYLLTLVGKIQTVEASKSLTLWETRRKRIRMTQ